MTDIRSGSRVAKTTRLRVSPPRFSHPLCAESSTPSYWDYDAPKRHRAEAKAICSGCPERVACALFAMEARLVGVWGGREFGINTLAVGGVLGE